MTQLGSGDPTIFSLRAEGADANIVRMQVTPRIVGHVVPGVGWTGVFAPQSWSGDYVFNGWDVEDGDVFVISSQLGCHAVGENRDNLSCGLRTELLIRKIGGLLGVGTEAVSLPDMRLSLGPQNAKAFRHSLNQLLRASCVDGKTCGALAPAAEHWLYEVVACLIANFMPVGSPLCDERTSSRAVVRKAMNVVSASSGPLMLSELCRAVGVSRTRLFESFSTELSESPASFIRNVRLTELRDILANRESPPGSVKEAMLNQGVVNRGRFASEYHRLFGEYPSETLSRTSNARQPR